MREIELLPEIFRHDGVTVYLRIKKEKSRWKIRYLQTVDNVGGGYITRLKVNGKENMDLDSVARHMFNIIQSLPSGDTHFISLENAYKKRELKLESYEKNVF